MAKLSELYLLVEKASKNKKNAFKSAMARLDISQEELADETDVDPSTISRYKTGKRQPSLDTARSLLGAGFDVLNVFLKSGSTEKRVKTVNRSKRHASKVSEAMRKASQEAQSPNQI